MAVPVEVGSSIRNFQNLDEPEVVVRRKESNFVRGMVKRCSRASLYLKRTSAEIPGKLQGFLHSHDSDPRSRRGSGSSKGSGSGGSSANNPASTNSQDRVSSRASVTSQESSSRRVSASSEPRQPWQQHSPTEIPVSPIEMPVAPIAIPATQAIPAEPLVGGKLGEPVARVTDPLATRLRCLREKGQPLASYLVNLANRMADRARIGGEEGGGVDEDDKDDEDDWDVAELATRIVRLLVAATNALDFKVSDAPAAGASDKPQAAGERVMPFKSAYMTLCDEFVACYDDPETLLQCLALIIPDVKSADGAPSQALPPDDGSATSSQWSPLICSTNVQADNLSKMDRSWLQYGKVLKVRAMMRREKLSSRPRVDDLTAAIEREQAKANKAIHVVRTMADLPSHDRKLLVSATGSARNWRVQAKAAEKQVSELKRELAIEQSTPPDPGLLKAVAALGPWVRDLETYLGRTWASTPAARPGDEPASSQARSARGGKGGMRARFARKSRRGRARVLAGIVAAKRRAVVVRAALARFVTRVRAALSRPAAGHPYVAGSDPAARATGEARVRVSSDVADGVGQVLANAQHADLSRPVPGHPHVVGSSDAAARMRQVHANAQHAEIVEAREIAVEARIAAADELARLENLYRQARPGEGTDARPAIPGFPQAEDTRLARLARMAAAQWSLFVRASALNPYAGSMPRHELDGGQEEHGYQVSYSKDLREVLQVIHIAEILKTLSEEQLAAVLFGLQCQGKGDYMSTPEKATYELMSHLVRAEDETREATRQHSPPVLAAAA